MTQIKLTINGKEVSVPAGSTVLQACEVAGVEVPRFCYHERLSVAGNCRMCLVEVEGAPPKPQASCAVPAMENMSVRTDTPMVKEARHGVMEFLLINHPLDCPICDQGGECDLQDQAFGYGYDASRFADNKRAVEEKNMGPLIKTEMTRCIHCTRCIRFATEVAGVPELGAIGRGEDMEITTYLEASLTSELSGNMIDLCPVGALTSKPYAFTARPWELRKTETIDVMDALGSHIRVDMRGREAMRIMPRECDDINEEWLSDKSRFVWDGLNTQRLDRPYIKENGKLQPATWQEAFHTIAGRLRGKSQQTAAIAGDLVCAEGQFALLQLLDALGVPHRDCRQDGAQIPTGNREHYIMNSTIAGIETADAILLIGTNPRVEAPVLNARIGRLARAGVPVLALGEPTDLTYPCEWLGVNPQIISTLSHPKLAAAKNPIVIIGQGALARTDGAAILKATLDLCEHINATFNMLHTAAARVAGLDMGFVPRIGGKDTNAILQANDIENIILYGADEIDMNALDKSFVIYIGSHGDAGAHCADIILPSAAYTEKQAIYVNTEGRAQMTEQAAFPPGDAREDWKIFRALAEVLSLKLGFDNKEELRARLEAHAPEPTTPAIIEITTAPLTGAIKNFYFTNPIARASKIMADCERLQKAQAQKGAA